MQSSGFADCHLHADGFQASYFYGNNGVNYGAPQITVDCHGAGGNGQAGNLFLGIPSSRYFGWSAACANAGGCTPTGANGLVFGVTGITLAVQETSGPQLTATGQSNLYNEAGWVRGTYPANLAATDPSGICAMQVTANSMALNSYNDPLPDQSNWSQCPGGALGASVDTTAYPDGAGSIKLAYTASNAAAVTSSLSRSIDVDNQVPSVALSGPTDVASTDGTQYITASASAGPSGVAAINCAVDGGSEVAFAGAAASIPVSGLGRHVVSCVAENHALNAAGLAGESPPATLAMSIRQPSASAITFAHIADALRCRRVTERVEVPGKTRTVRRHGKEVVVKGRAHIVTRRVRRCHARTVRRRVTIVVKRHGRRVKVRRVQRVVLLPHRVEKPTRTIGHGKSTTVSGFVGLTDGAPIAQQPVTVYAAADNGRGRYRPIATATTDINGEWSAKVRPGPSRLLFAAYGGDSTVLPASSSTVRLNVPAQIALAITPRILPWKAKTRIRGHLVGGYVPADGVALRLLARYPGAKRPSRCWRCAPTTAEGSASPGATTPGGAWPPIRSRSRRPPLNRTIPSLPPRAERSGSRSAERRHRAATAASTTDTTATNRAAPSPIASPLRGAAQTLVSGRPDSVGPRHH